MEYLFLAEAIGVIAFSLSGYFVASKERLDLLGIFISSFLSALGGGIIRDVLCGKPPITFVNLFPTTLVLAVLTVAIIFRLNQKLEIENKKFFVLSDTLGLVSFSISGAITALEVNFNFFGVVFLTLITAVGGGVMRDILLNRIPLLLTAQIYGTVSIVIGIFIYLFWLFEALNFLSISFIFVFGLVFRLLAHKYDWHLPRI